MVPQLLSVTDAGSALPFPGLETSVEGVCFKRKKPGSRDSHQLADRFDRKCSAPGLKPPIIRLGRRRVPFWVCSFGGTLLGLAFDFCGPGGGICF
jgi:hypothetical protein